MVALERELPSAPVASDDAIPLRLRRRGGSPRQVLAVSLIGALVLGMLAAADLPGWADRLDDGFLADQLRPIAAQWGAAAARLGLDRPHEAVRNAMRRALDWQW